MPKPPKSLPRSTGSPLTAAIRKCNLKALQKLLATSTIDVNAPLADAGGATPFQLATDYGAGTPLALALLDAGAKPAREDLNLIWAIRTGRPDVVRAFIAGGADVNMHAIMGTPIEVAAHSGHAEMVRDLIAGGADVNAGSISFSPLEAALDRNHTDAALVLIKAGAKLNRDRSIYQLLHEAIDKKNHAVMTALIEAGADVNERERGGTGQTPLIRAAAIGKADMVRALLAAGADVHARDTKGMTALDHARKAKRAEIAAILEDAAGKRPARVDPDEELLFATEAGDGAKVQAMLAAGANVDARDRRARTGGFTPLMLAAAAGNAVVVTALLKAGADLNGRDEPPTKDYQPQSFVFAENGQDMIPATGWLYARTALHCAAAGGHAEVVRTLLDAGADVNDADRCKTTPLHLAAEAGAVETVDELLRRGAAVDAANACKETSLFLATQGNHAAVVRRLLEAKPKLEAKDRRGRTGLHIAAAKAHPAVVKALVDAGADANAIDQDGTSVLHAAMHAQEMVAVKEHGFEYKKSVAPGERMLEVARLLLQAGADSRVKDEGGRTALFWASRSAPKKGPLADLVRLLQDAERSAKSLPWAKPAAKPAVKRKPAETDRKPTFRKTGLHLQPPDFAPRAKDKAFQRAVADLEALCGTPRQPMGNRAGAFKFHAHSKKKFDLKKVNADFAARGYCVFTVDATQHNPIVLLPTPDRYKAIAFMGTNGDNFGIGSADIVRWLKNLQKTQPFVLTGIGFDFLDGYFTTKIAKPAELARRMYEFCPDVVNQGTGDLPALAAALRRERRLFFWWD